MTLEDYRKWLEEQVEKQHELWLEAIARDAAGSAINRNGKADAYRKALEQLKEVTE